MRWRIFAVGAVVVVVGRGARGRGSFGMRREGLMRCCCYCGRRTLGFLLLSFFLFETGLGWLAAGASVLFVYGG